MRSRAFAALYRRVRDEPALLDQLAAARDAEQDASVKRSMSRMIDSSLRARDANAKRAAEAAERDRQAKAAKAEREQANKELAELTELAKGSPSRRVRQRVYEAAAKITDRSLQFRHRSLMRQVLVADDIRALVKMFGSAPVWWRKAAIGSALSKLRTDKKALPLYEKALEDDEEAVRDEVYRQISWLGRDPAMKALYAKALKREKSAKLKQRYERYVK